MKEFILSIAPQEWITFAGIALTAVASIIATVIGKNGQKTADDQNKTWTGIFGTIIETLTNVKTASDDAKQMTGENAVKLEDAVKSFKQGLSDNKDQNLAVASFVLECFKQSNLSDEKKASLQLMFDQLFYQDKGELITALQDGKAAVEKTLTEVQEEKAALEAELEDVKLRLQNAVANKKSRRL